MIITDQMKFTSDMFSLKIERFEDINLKLYLVFRDLSRRLIGTGFGGISDTVRIL